MQASPGAGSGAFAVFGAGAGDGGPQDLSGAAAADRLAVWFRAATIAVPICGALILLMLIALAVRILRTDSQIERNSKLR